MMDVVESTNIETKVLLVEDDMALSGILHQRLSDEGYHTIHADTVEQALRTLHEHDFNFEICVLDIGLKNRSGFEVAQVIKQKTNKMPIVFITAYGDPEDRVRGLELGGEDYIVKPFHWRELSLRIKNVLQRYRYTKLGVNQNPSSHWVKIGECKIDFSAYIISDANQMTHQLSQKECLLLRLLWERRGQVVSRDEILDFVWSVHEFPSPRTVDNFILKLRKILGDDSSSHQVIKSIRGVGYKIEMDGYKL